MLKLRIHHYETRMFLVFHYVTSASSYHVHKIFLLVQKTNLRKNNNDLKYTDLSKNEISSSSDTWTH